MSVREVFEGVGPLPPEPTDPDALRAALDAATRALAEARGERDQLIEARRADLARERLLAETLRNRSRNTLALIRSIIRRTLESGASHEDSFEHLDGRVAAIARYQRTTAEGLPCPVELEDILRDELLPTHCLDQPGLTLSGPPVVIPDEALVPVTLAMHELATNSLKFGALPQPGADVSITWSMTQMPSGGMLHLTWAEQGMAITDAGPRGFGRIYLEEGLPYQLGATTRFDLRPGGLVCSIDLPIRHVGVAPSQDRRVLEMS